MAAEEVWLLIPVLGVLAIITLIITIIVIARQRCNSSSDKGDVDDIELESEGIQPPGNHHASNTSLSSDDESLPKRGSSPLASRKLPSTPPEEPQTPQPDVVASGSGPAMPSSETGTYAPQGDFDGQQSPLIDIDPDTQNGGDGKGTLTRSPSPVDLEENREADAQTGETVIQVRDRNSVYSIIDRERTTTLIKLD